MSLSNFQEQTKDLKLTAIISTLRHGEKDEIGELTKVGHYQGALKGAETQYLEGNVILFHSGIKRVKETLTSFAKHLHVSDVKEVINPDDKEIEYQHFTSHYLQYLYDPKNKGELFTNWDKVNGKEEESKRTNDFLNLRNTSTEPRIYPSPKHMAIRLARVLSTQIDFATITVPEVITNFVNGTHEPVLMSFLYYFMQDYNPTSIDFINEIGGSVKYTEGFEIYIYQDLFGENKVIFSFRDTQKEIDQIELKEFCLSEKV